MSEEEFKDEEFTEESQEQPEEQSNQNQQPGQTPVFVRVKLPRGKEVLGKVESRVGANRMIVTCFDGKTRNCGVPGRMKRKLWIRPGNIILVEPWEFEGDKKGDIIFSYTPAQIQVLEKKGYLKETDDEF